MDDLSHIDFGDDDKGDRGHCVVAAVLVGLPLLVLVVVLAAMVFSPR